jgi:hypothetical protein
LEGRKLKTNATNNALFEATLNFGMATAKLNMAVAKPQVIFTLAQDEILTPFQRPWWGLQGSPIQKWVANGANVARNVYFQHGCHQTRGSFNFKPVYDIDTLQNAMMAFRIQKF